MRSVNLSEFQLHRVYISQDDIYVKITNLSKWDVASKIINPIMPATFISCVSYLRLNRLNVNAAQRKGGTIMCVRGKTFNRVSGLLILLLFWLSPSDATAETLRSLVIAAGLPTTTPDKLIALAKNKEAVVRNAVAGNRRAPNEALILLSADPDPDVRMTLALNIDAPEAAKLPMARDPELGVRMRLAKCGFMFPSVLKILAKDKSLEVRRLVARNYNATPEVLMLLVNDDDEQIRNSIANHEVVTPEILRKLSVSSK